MFKHKGVRIKVYHKNTTLDLFLCGGTLLFTALLFLFLKVRFETINNFYLQLESNMKEMLIYIFTSLTLSIAILVILKIIFKAIRGCRLSLTCVCVCVLEEHKGQSWDLSSRLNRNGMLVFEN
ncbi:MAG: hypothetical protein ACI33I_12800, partial [Clostridium sp.]